MLKVPLRLKKFCVVPDRLKYQLNAAKCFTGQVTVSGKYTTMNEFSLLLRNIIVETDLRKVNVMFYSNLIRHSKVVSIKSDRRTWMSRRKSVHFKVILQQNSTSGLQTQTCKFMLVHKPENLHRLSSQRGLTETEYCVNLEFLFFSFWPPWRVPKAMSSISPTCQQREKTWWFSALLH